MIYGISLGPQYVIVLGSSVIASVGSSEGFKYGNIDGILHIKSLGIEIWLNHEVESWRGYQSFLTNKFVSVTTQ